MQGADVVGLRAGKGRGSAKPALASPAGFGDTTIIYGPNISDKGHLNLFLAANSAFVSRFPRVLAVEGQPRIASARPCVLRPPPPLLDILSMSHALPHAMPLSSQGTIRPPKQRWVASDMRLCARHSPIARPGGSDSQLDTLRLP